MTLVCVPASGSAFPIGTTTVNCCATDGSSNATVCTFTVTVRDAELPRLIVPADIVTPNDAGKCGAVVSFKVTATDNCCGSPAVLCSPASGCLFPKGVTTVKCAATDPSGNTASCAFTVTVLDKEPPVVECKPARSPDCKNTPASRADDDEKSFGILQLFTRDNCDPNPKIFVKDSATGLISGPYQSGDKVKLTHSRRDKPNQNKPAPAGIPQIQIRGDALIYAVDASGNISQTLRCKHGGFCRDRDQDEDRDDCKPDSDREHHQD